LSRTRAASTGSTTVGNRRRSTTSRSFGAYDLTIDEFDTSYVGVGVRILVDPNDTTDITAVAALQEQFAIHTKAARPFVPTDYDSASLDATRDALLALARSVSGFEGAFGASSEVDPIKHLIGTAAGWSGLPAHEAFYVNVDPGLPAGGMSCASATYPSMGSGRSRCTTPRDSFPTRVNH
jgi:hypothetical protein